MKREEAQHLRLTKQEKEQIKRNADLCGRSVSAYIRECALNMCVLDINHESIVEHTQIITTLCNAIIDLSYTIRETGQHTPPDLKYIYEKMQEIQKSEEKFLQEQLAFNCVCKKFISESVKKTVNKRISKRRE